jgi:hypothetical protein
MFHIAARSRTAVRRPLAPDADYAHRRAARGALAYVVAFGGFNSSVSAKSVPPIVAHRVKWP